MWTELKYTKAIVTGVENFIEKLNNEVNNSFSNGLGGIGVLAWGRVHTELSGNLNFTNFIVTIELFLNLRIYALYIYQEIWRPNAKCRCNIRSKEIVQLQLHNYDK